MKNLIGIISPLLTPFDEQDKVNEPVLRQVIQMGLRQGVNGFYVCGGTSEAFLLTIEERKHILEVVADELQGKAAIIAHIGCLNTSHAIDLANHAYNCGADAMASVVPFYFAFGFEAIKGYYRDIMDSCPLPMIIYNIPGSSGITFNMEQMKSLVADRRIIGIKHTSSDYYVLERLRNIRDDLLIYNGSDEMFLAGLSMGADGGIGTTYNFMADRFVRIFNNYKGGDMSAALDEQNKANNIIQALIKVGVIPGTKAILEFMGIHAGICRRPFQQLTLEQREYLYHIWRVNNNM